MPNPRFEFLYHALVERVRTIGIFLVTDQQRVASWNVGAAQLTGYRRSEILGQPFSILMPSMEQSLLLPVGLESRRSARRQAWITRKDGTRFWGELAFSVVEDRSRVQYAVIMYDRTPSIELNEANRRLSAILEGTTDFVGFTDAAGRIRYLNAGGRRLLGISADADLNGLSFAEVHPKWATDVLLHEAIPAAMKAGTWTGETALLSRTGREIPILQVLVVHPTPDGGVDFISTIAQDITEQKRHEAERNFLIEVGSGLVDSLELSARLSSLTGLVVPRLADWCVIASRREKEVTWLAGHHRDQAIDVQLKNAVGTPSLFDETAPVGLHHVLKSETPELVRQVTPEWLADARGDPSIITPAHSLMIVPLRAHGHMVAAMSFGRSQTRNGYTEEDVQFALDIAKHAALFLDNARLYQAEQKAVKTRDEVLSIVAHDLRNPLNTILMSSQLIPEIAATIDDKTRHQLDIIGRSVKRMNRLIEDLLDVARAKSGQPLVVQQENLDLRELLADLCETFEPKTSKKGLSLTCDVPESDIVVFGDRTRLMQILGNLIGNAIKFTTQGGIKVDVVNGEHEVLFSVADTGPGISEGDLPHLFDRFWQVSRTSRGGAGLGLPIVKGLVEAHGGHIWVDSKVDQGSTFYFTLPRAMEQPDGDKSSAAGAEHQKHFQEA